MKTINTATPASQNKSVCPWWKKVIEMSAGIQKNGENDGIVAEIQSMEN